MDKFYVKPKGSLISNNKSSNRVSTTCRTSSEVFQSTSSDKRLRVGNICSKIRHKIEDNLTPKISGKLYKTGKHSKSLTALSSIGASAGKYTLTNKNSEIVETTPTGRPKVQLSCKIIDSNNASSNEQLNPYAECYNTLQNTLDLANPLLNSQVDSDEDEAQLSFNIEKTSLEDEIFEELEKVAHDENKLISVLKTFDKIIFDYNDPSPMQLDPISSIIGNYIPANTDNNTKEDRNSPTHNNPDIRTVSDLTDKIIDNTGGFSKSEQIGPVSGSTDKIIDTTPEQEGDNTGGFSKSEQIGCSRLQECKSNETNKLQKSASTLSLTRKKFYQSPDSPCLRQMRHAFAQQEKSKSVWELSNATKIPILKAIPLKTRSKSFCYNSENSPTEFKSVQTEKSLKTSKPLMNAQAKSGSSVALTNKNQRYRDDIIKAVKSTPKNSIKSQTKTTTSNSKSLQAKNFPCKNTKSTCVFNSNLIPTPHTSLSVTGRGKTSDELLDKCLEKGQQILRKVELLKPQRTQVTSCPKKSLTRTKSNSSNKISKDNLTTKRKQWLQKLNYANEEKIAAPSLELCKIIPPVLGETSDKHAELLVQVSTAAHLSSKKQRIIPEGSQLAIAQNMSSKHDLLTKNQDSDSDDSGHISNENMEISINHTSPASSPSTSLCEISSSTASSATASICDNSYRNGVVTKSLKMSEVLKKFQCKSSTNTNKTKITSSSSKSPLFEDLPKCSLDARFCTTCRVAEVESVSVIRTHVEIYPNYTKEVTIRLR